MVLPWIFRVCDIFLIQRTQEDWDEERIQTFTDSLREIVFSKHELKRLPPVWCVSNVT